MCVLAVSVCHSQSACCKVLLVSVLVGPAVKNVLVFSKIVFKASMYTHELSLLSANRSTQVCKDVTVNCTNTETARGICWY